MRALGWRELDVLLVTGDAYFDHPSHGAAMIGRVLERAGYRVGIIARPDWRDPESFTQLGRPSLFVGVTAGAVDSLVNNYTAGGARRGEDVYAPGGKGGGRPDLATVVYANRLRQAFPGLPIVLGGIEASLRRFAYFDPVKKSMRRSVLVDSRADLLVWGPGEEQALEVAHRLASGQSLDRIWGTVQRLPRDASLPEQAVELPSFKQVIEDPRKLLEQALLVEQSGRPFFNHPMYQRYDEGNVLAEPRPEVSGKLLDSYFELPFTRNAHPSYHEPIPALETVRWSIISHRGCPGGCSFCGLAAHQGRMVVSRSDESLLAEARAITRHPEFKGTISDVGGPTANAHRIENTNPEACRRCRRPSCLVPRICKHLQDNQIELVRILGRIGSLDSVRHVFLASGIRHDLALTEPEFIEQVAARFTGGHLKVAPEHVAPGVLELMRKPSIEHFERFERIFAGASGQAGKQQYLVPYFIAGFPGCSPEQADAAGRWLLRRDQRVEQAQIYIPLAGTVAAAMHASGVDQRGNRLYIAGPSEKKRQKTILVRARPKDGRSRRAMSGRGRAR